MHADVLVLRHPESGAVHLLSADPESRPMVWAELEQFRHTYRELAAQVSSGVVDRFVSDAERRSSGLRVLFRQASQVPQPKIDAPTPSDLPPQSLYRQLFMRTGHPISLESASAHSLKFELPKLVAPAHSPPVRELTGNPEADDR